MRLIDADKLVEICRKGWKLFGRDNEKLKHWVDENDIREQPTVKAIPIKWLKEWEGYEQGMAIVNLKDIVEYWEKENDSK